MRRFPPQRVVYVRESSAHDWCWIFFWLVIVGLFVTFMVLIFTHPYPAYPYYRDGSPGGYRDAKGRLNCTVGEYMDTALDLCAPNVSTPIPICHALMDTSVNACDSFYRHMSGKWLDSHMNENRGFTYVYRKNQKHIHDIVTDPKSGPVYDFYRSCLDTLVHKQHVVLDKSQVKHVKEHILGALSTHADLPIVFARLASYGFPSPFVVTIEMHPTELKMVPLVEFDAPSIPFGDGGGDSDVQFVLTYLTEQHTDAPFTGSFISYVRSDRFLKDMTTMGTLLDASPANFWKLYFRSLNGYQMEEDLDTAKQSVWLLDREYIRNLMTTMNTVVSIEQWRKYVEFCIDYSTRDYLPDLPADSYFRIHNPVARRERKYLKHRLNRRDVAVSSNECISLTHKLLPGMIGNLFLHRTMPHHEQVKRQVTEVVEKVRDSFARLIQNASWLSEQTRSKAVDKIKSIIVRSVVPTYYEAEPFAERLTRDHYLRNLNFIRQYFATRNFELWTSGEPNRDVIQRFGAPLTEVNAFYSPVSNTITIFAGILNKPFYSRDYAEVALYATIGMIAGHELGHALDNTGRLFDKDGSLSRVEPWTPEEYAEFSRRTLAIVKEYGAPMGCENEHYGEQTLGEDMADINGLRAAYHAYFDRDRPLGEKQWFFQIFAQMWAEKYDQETLCARVNDDEHAIALFRVDKTLRQMPEFWEAFGCRVGQGMVNEEAVYVY